MKKISILALILLAAALPALAERADDSKRKSKNGVTEGSVGDVSVVVEYGRPEVRGRAIWGNLVPMGKVWRTGADEATTIEIDGDLQVEGASLPAGRYALFTVPGESEWTVIFSKKADQWGAYNYSKDDDQLRVAVTPQAGEHVEALDFVLEDGALVLRWAELRVPIALSAG